MKAIVTVQFDAGPNEEHGLDKKTTFKVNELISGDVARLAVNQGWALETADFPVRDTKPHVPTNA